MAKNNRIKSVMHTGAKLEQNQKGNPVAVSTVKPVLSATMSEFHHGNTESSPSGSQ